jgi:hypothetical protein
LTATPTYTCPRGYTYDATKAVGQKCRKGGNKTEAETAVCPPTYTYNSTSQMCTKAVMTPAPAPGPSNMMVSSPSPFDITGSSPSSSPFDMTGSSPSPSLFGAMGSSPSPSSGMLDILATPAPAPSGSQLFDL